MKKLQFILLFVVFHRTDCQSVELTDSHRQIITFIKNYHNCDLTVSFGAAPEEEDRRWNQPMVFRQSHFKLRGIEGFEEARRPLVIFFSDLWNQKFQLAASAVDSSRSVFLFFVNDKMRVGKFFKNIYFPFGYKYFISEKNETNQNEEIISQVKLDHKKRRIVKLRFATWTEVTGIKSFARSEETLSGRLLRAGLFNNPPLSTVVVDGNNLKLKGFISEFAEELETHLNFKFTYTLIHEIGLKENRTWGGGMGLMMNDSLDIFFTPLFTSPDRYVDIDFSFPLLESNIGMFLKKSDNVFKWNAYFKPFDFTIWCAIILTIIVGSTTLTFLEFYQKIDVIRRLRNRPIKLPIKCVESFLKIHGAMCGQALTQSRFDPLRVLQLTIHSTALLILIFYSAIFLSMITAPEYKPPISSFKDLVGNNQYKLGCVRGQPWHIFQQSDDEIMKKVFRTHIKTQNPIPMSLSEGHNRMCSDDKYAFITFSNLANSYMSLGCKLLIIESLGDTQLAIAFQHNSPFANIFDKTFLKMFESGVLKKIEHKYFPLPQKMKGSWSPITVMEILPILYIHLMCITFSVMILIAEIFIHRIVNQRKVESC